MFREFTFGNVLKLQIFLKFLKGHCSSISFLNQPETNTIVFYELCKFSGRLLMINAKNILN